jgi:hypothetical protein
MLTEFGKVLRKFRIDKGELLKTMADKLEYTSSYLSAIEVGKRSIPEDLIDRLISLYALDTDVSSELREAERVTNNQIKLNLGGMNQMQKDAALIFARTFETMDEKQTSKLIEFLKHQSKE